LLELHNKTKDVNFGSGGAGLVLRVGGSPDASCGFYLRESFKARPT